MTDNFETFSFESDPQYIGRNNEVSLFKNMQQLNCIAFVRSSSSQIQIKLGFVWDTLIFEKLAGTFTWFCRESGYGDKQNKHCIDLSAPGLTEQNILLSNSGGAYLWYTFDLTLHRIPTDRQNAQKKDEAMSQGTQTDNQVMTEDKNSSVVLSGSPTSQGTPAIKTYPLPTDISYDKMFAPSNQHDGVLLIGEKKLHVNRALLSYHSTYFRDLFAGKHDEENGIPIEDVSYENFGLLMSLIYPEMVFANDQNAEILLELGNRFKIPAVMRHVEHHFIHGTT